MNDYIDIVTGKLTNIKTIDKNISVNSNDIAIIIAINKNGDSSNCQNVMHNNCLFTWNVNKNSMIKVYASIKNDKISIYWKINQSYGGMIKQDTSIVNEQLDQKYLEYVNMSGCVNIFYIRISKYHTSLKINNKQVSIRSENASNLDNFMMTINKYQNHEFNVNGSLELPINKLRVKKLNVKENDRNNYCQIDLSEFDCHEDCPVVDVVYITPEIYYKIKNCKKKLNINKKNNVTNKYNHLRMPGLVNCIANPITNFKGFTMEFIVKNLILFGILYGFVTFLANPTVENARKFIICGVVVLLYNMLHMIFCILENIFVWACKYSTSVTELVGEDY